MKKVDVVSTVGAGDNFNAGVVYGLLSALTEKECPSLLSKEEWCNVISCGLDFSARACTLIENYIDKEWATAYRQNK